MDRRGLGAGAINHDLVGDLERSDMAVTLKGPVAELMARRPISGFRPRPNLFATKRA